MTHLAAAMDTGERLCSKCSLFFTTPLPKRLPNGRLATLKSSVLHETLDDFRSAALVERCWVCLQVWISIDIKEQHLSLPGEFKISCSLEERLRLPHSLLLSIFWRYGPACTFSITPGELKSVGSVVVELMQTGSLVADVPVRRELQSNTGSERSLDIVKGWVTDCVLRHSECGKAPTQPSYSPSRLIHFSLTEDYWRLHVTKEDGMPSSADYISLSYRWGQHNQLTLNASTIKRFRAGLPISTLPKVFQDAIHISRLLSVQYIWIDSLCILQDSMEDWEVESSQMRAVYANSYCTVAASRATDPTVSLFNERDPKEIDCGHIMTNWESQQNGLAKAQILVSNAWENQLLRSPLHKRGWAMQERILPPRILYFTERQILWECGAGRKCEIFEREEPREYMHPSYSGARLPSPRFKVEASAQDDSISTKATAPGLYNDWVRMVELYSDCSLTVPSDKLVALSGLAELYQDLSGDEYLAGLWRFHIFEGLVWCRTYSISYDCGHTFRPADYHAPSWSWAAVDGPVSLSSFLTLEGYNPYRPFDMRSVSVTTVSGKSPHGRVSSAILVLDGYGLLYEPPKSGLSAYNHLLDNALGISVDFDYKEDYELSDEQRPKYLLLLSVSTNSRVPDDFHDVLCGQGIMIQKIDGLGEEFVRVGRFWVRNWTAEHLDKFGLFVAEDGAIAKKPDVVQRSFKII